ncbi:MAG TPA: VOC family protein [Blastocatellia bacterium]|nr:VOC family protein [Blastocatellia bacterium]
MPRLNKAVPTFIVSDVTATTKWYADNLGFTVHPFPKDPPYVFASIIKDDIELMLMLIDDYQKPDLSRQRPSGLWDAYIRMTGVEQFYEELRSKVEIKLPLTRRPYGDMEFEVKDPNGYILVFSE